MWDSMAESKQNKVDGNWKGEGVVPSPNIYLKIDFWWSKSFQMGRNDLGGSQMDQNFTISKDHETYAIMKCSSC